MKNISWVKTEDKIDRNKITRRLKKFPSRFKNLNDQKLMKAVLQAIEANLGSINQRVSGELDIS